MPRKRKFRPRSRISGVRDANLIVIAFEGAKTEKKYFEEMASQKYYYNSKVKVYPLVKEAVTASSPEHVVRQLNSFKEKCPDLQPDDEFWLVIDVDRWGDEKLSEIAQRCHQKDYKLAISNPCFELWLLLHWKTLDEYSEDVLDEFLENSKVTKNRTRLDVELLKILGEYNKSKLKVEHYLPYVERAIENARAR